MEQIREQKRTLTKDNDHNDIAHISQNSKQKSKEQGHILDPLIVKQKGCPHEKWLKSFIDQPM